MNASNIKFRASAAGKIMVEPKSKTEPLSETTKQFLLEVFLREKYGRKKEIKSKFLEKGNAVEEDSVTLFSKFKGRFFKKNTTHYESAFFSGTPDCITENEIIDFKSSWDIFTFFDARYEKINPLYYWQMQVYMHLSGRNHARLVYCLIDTPEYQIESEKRNAAWRLGGLDSIVFDAKMAEIERNMKYDDIPIQERLFEVKIPRNDADIDRLIAKVEQCRTYMNQVFF